MRLFDLLYRQFDENPLSDAFAHKVLGFWKKYSTGDSLKIINQLSQGLVELGIKPGDKISIVSEGRPEWCFVDMACQQVGAVLVPLYPTLSPQEYKTILEEAEVKMIFVSNGINRAISKHVVPPSIKITLLSLIKSRAFFAIAVFCSNAYTLFRAGL